MPMISHFHQDLEIADPFPMKGSNSYSNGNRGRESERIITGLKRRRLTIVHSTHDSISTIYKKHRDDIEDNLAYEMAEVEYEMQGLARSEFVIENIKIEQEKNLLFFVQEDYDCLLSELNLATIGFEKRFKIFYCVVQGLHAIHNKFLCHRLISPETITILIRGDEYQAKITNFSKVLHFCHQNSCTSEPIYRSQRRSKDDPYIAPEVQKEKCFGLKSDIWSLGVLLNYILYNTTKNISFTATDVKIELPKNTPQWLRELLSSMLNLNPNNRHDIGTVLDVVRVAIKCADVVEKYISLCVFDN